LGASSMKREGGGYVGRQKTANVGPKPQDVILTKKRGSRSGLLIRGGSNRMRVIIRESAVGKADQERELSKRIFYGPGRRTLILSPSEMRW